MRSLALTGIVIFGAIISFELGCIAVDVRHQRETDRLFETMYADRNTLNASSSTDPVTNDHNQTVSDGDHSLYALTVPGGCLYYGDIGMTFVEQKCSDVDNDVGRPSPVSVYGRDVVGGCIWHNRNGVAYAPYACDAGTTPDSDDDTP